MPESSSSGRTVGEGAPDKVDGAVVNKPAGVVIDGRGRQDLRSMIDYSDRGFVAKMLCKLVDKIRQMAD